MTNENVSLDDVRALHELMFPSAGQCLRVAVQLKLATLLADGPLSVAELAEKTGAAQRPLYQALRVLTDHQVFAEVGPGVFENTPRSVLLQKGVPGSQYEMTLLSSEEWLWACYANLEHSVRTGAPAFVKAYGTALWPWLGQNPDKARQFNLAMDEFSQTLGPRIVESYPDFGKGGVVADLGGGTGSFVANIVRDYPTVTRGIVVDQPSVIEQAKAREDLQDLITEGRLDFFPGDFFEDVPTGVDLYVTKQITHSWSDEKLLSLLKRCRDASPTAGFAAAELVHLPDSPAFVKHFDVMMYVTMAGFLRTEEEYADLFRQAGYELTGVVPTDTAFSIIQAVPVD